MNVSADIDELMRSRKQKHEEDEERRVWNRSVQEFTIYGNTHLDHQSSGSVDECAYRMRIV